MAQVQLSSLAPGASSYMRPDCLPKHVECPPSPCPKPVAVPCPKPCPTPVKVECPAPCPPPVKVECPAPCPKPCADPCQKTASGWSWLGALVLWFVVFLVLFWLIYFSVKPSFVMQTDSNQVDTAKVLLAAVITSLIVVIIIWLIKAAISRRY